MKTLFLILALTFQAPAQTTMHEAMHTGLTVLHWKWNSSHFVWLTSVPATITVKVRNDGARTISSVTYTVEILDHIRGDRIKDRLTFTTDDKPLKPSQERTFRKRFDYWTNNASARLLIVNVEYAGPEK